MITMSVLRQEASHLLLIRTNLGYGTVLWRLAHIRAVVPPIHSFNQILLNQKQFKISIADFVTENFLLEIFLYIYSLPQPNVSWSVVQRKDCLEEWTARRKASAYLGQHNVEKPRAHIHALSGNRNRDPVYGSSRPTPQTMQPLDQP
jgi:hypothetical protein